MNAAVAQAYEVAISVASIFIFIFIGVLMSRAAGQDKAMKRLFSFMLANGILANVIYLGGLALHFHSSVGKQSVMILLMMLLDLLYSFGMYKYLLTYLNYKQAPITRKQERSYWIFYWLMILVTYFYMLICSFYGFSGLLANLIGWTPTLAYNIHVYRYVLQRKEKLDKSAVRGWAYVLFMPVLVILFVGLFAPNLQTYMLMYVLFAPTLYIAVQAQDANLLTKHLAETNARLRERDELQQVVNALAMDYVTVVAYDLRDEYSMKIYKVHERVQEKMSDLLNGKTLDQVTEILINQVIHPEDRHLVADQVSPQYIREHMPWPSSKSLIYRNEQERYGEEKIVRLNEHKVVIGFADRDDQVRREQEQQRQLGEALAQANAASKAKSQFLSNMSHDIRTPMNAIIGFSTIASTHVDEPQLITDYLGKITTASKHLLSLINDVLDMSRIESGRVSLDEKPNRLPDILHTLRSVVQSGVNSKHLEFFLDSEDVKHEAVICDELRVNQVLLNCLSNAIKYTMPGGTVGLKILEKPGDREGWANYIFKIKDTGIGMSEEFAEHIFESFTREENSTVNKIEGTGLGMAITMNIVEMMNGNISVKSKKGEGSEFTIEIPMKIDDEVSAEERDTTALKGLRVLIADDDFETCKSVVGMLDLIGMKGEWATTGKDAVERAKFAYERNESYHAYIIDWLMPDLNGIEVVRRIRRTIGDETPIYILTAYDWADIEAEAREAGVTAILEKPIFRSELVDVLLDAAEGIIARDKANVQASQQEETQSRLAGRKVLIVEDIEVNREIIKALLSKTDLQFDDAENGALAVEKLQHAQPGDYDLVLMDVQMPVMNGLEATEKIRSLGIEWLEKLPILAMTANAFREDQEKALEAGMTDFLTKPIEIAEVMAALEKYLVK